MQKGFSAVEGLALIVVLAIAGFALWRALPTTNTQDEQRTEKSNTSLVVPDEVSVALNIESGQPFLHLSATVANAGCQKGPALEHKARWQDDTFDITISGYEHRQIDQVEEALTCSVLVTSQAEIPIEIEKFNAPQTKQLIITLGEKKNVYDLSLESFELTLSAINTPNTTLSSYSEPDTASVRIHPSDVYILYLSGKVDTGQEYKSDLRAFAKAAGYMPADEVYPGLQQSERNWLFVLLGNNLAPSGNKAINVGSLPNHENITVNLKAN